MTTTTPDDLCENALAVVHPSWHRPLAGVHDTIRTCLRGAIGAARNGEQVLPHPRHVLRAFATPLDEVRVLIMGQDPYPTPGHPIGLCFAVAADVHPLPRSLANIFTELTEDIGCPAPVHGDLTGWEQQGVMLLNRTLTVAAGNPASHAGRGWEDVTDAAVTALAKRGGPLVAILWGRGARSVAPRLGDVPRIESAHPSPLSAHRGFFGSKPFSAANAALQQQGAAPIDWARTAAP